MTKIITFSGVAGAGKDTCAAIFKKEFERRNKRVFMLAYGDYVKTLLSRNFGYQEHLKSEFRDLLQYFGTDIVRNKDPDFWVKIVALTIETLKDEYDLFIVTDARFENELELSNLVTAEITNILVKREAKDHITAEQKKHSSEIMTLDNDKRFDIIINNNSSVSELTAKSLVYINQILEQSEVA